ncbi:hypothetical protein [Sphingomonas parapaucimobilis]|jgi:hypothetical protein|uniref:hypothetical protein n=2 Tax=Sphingomonas parapaucimobilis TaxID=28213 RepID=UPI0039E7AC1A
MIRQCRAMSPCIGKAQGIVPAVTPRGDGISAVQSLFDDSAPPEEPRAFDWGYPRGHCTGHGNRSPMFQDAAMARFIEDEWIAGDETP